jgi:hypothetical protein
MLTYIVTYIDADNAQINGLVVTVSGLIDIITDPKCVLVKAELTQSGTR